MPEIKLTHVTKRWGKFYAVDDLSLDMEDNSFITLLGPSGCGKTTTLRMIAGLEEISKGEMYIGGRLINDVPPKDRDIAMVFQSYALYPHMTVYKNIAFGLELRKTPKDEIDKRVHEAAKILEIEHLLDRKPKALSGGQRQRVALGRAMVRNPAVFLLDEPLSALDGVIKESIKDRIKTIAREYHLTTIIVTHDPEEALTLSDRVLIIDQGSISQYARPDEIVHQPRNDFVRKFILRQLEIKRGNIYALFGDRPQLAGEAV